MNVSFTKKINCIEKMAIIIHVLTLLKIATNASRKELVINVSKNIILLWIQKIIIKKYVHR